MNCSHFEDRLIDAIDQPATDWPPDLRSHLAGCASCREFLETQQLLDQTLAAKLVPTSPSPRFRAAVLSKVHSEARTPLIEILPDLLNLAGAASLVTVVYFTTPGRYWLWLACAAAAAIVASLLKLEEYTEPRS
jgi:hypothetical protein